MPLRILLQRMWNTPCEDVTLGIREQQSLMLICAFEVSSGPLMYAAESIDSINGQWLFWQLYNLIWAFAVLYSMKSSFRTTPLYNVRIAFFFYGVQRDNDPSDMRTKRKINKMTPVSQKNQKE